jgi:alanine racemase
VVAGEGIRQARATVTVDLGAVAANCRTLTDTVQPAELWAVVKADGYGHGAAAVGRAALDAGAARLCVATLEEAAALRAEVPDAPVLVMSPLAPGEETEVAGVEVAVSSVEGLERLLAAVRPVGVHVKYDSGMGRWGMSADDALRAGEQLAAADGPLRLAGLMSHLASADSDNDFTSRQLDRFVALSDRFPPCPRHVANSAAAMWRPDARYDAVRCGVGVYGLHPAGGDPAEQGIVPAMRFESYVAQVKRLGAGESAGYGRRFVADRPIWIGLAPAGYADGVPRLLSGRADVLVRGRRRRIAATVSMDQLTFVIGEECDVEPGDRVILIGEDGDEAVRAEEWARLAETINYEVVTDIAPRRRRVEHVVVGP